MCAHVSACASQAEMGCHRKDIYDGHNYSGKEVVYLIKHDSDKFHTRVQT